MADDLEHAGVKGMKWGVRRAQAHKQGPIEKRVTRQIRKAGEAHRERKAEKSEEIANLSPRQLQVRSERAKFLKTYGATVAVAAGATATYYILAKNGNKSARSESLRVNEHLAKIDRMLKATKDAPIPKPPSKTLSNRFSDASDLAKMKAHAAAAVKEANAQLRARDNELSIPFPDRSYLEEWT
jgi:hypothetical protein